MWRTSALVCVPTRMDKHLLAGLAMAGSIMDAVGGLYLAYDLLGGPQGPLRTLTRAVTYTLLFALGTCPTFGWRVGALAAVLLGGLFALEIRDVVQGSRARKYAYAVTRGLTLGLVAALAFNVALGLIVAVLASIGIVIGYAFGSSAFDNYEDMLRPGFGRRSLRTSLVRGMVVFGVTASSVLLARHDMRLALEVGARLGGLMFFMSMCIAVLFPVLESFAADLPERRLGALGAVLVLGGFLLQTIQYVVVLLDVPVW